MVSEIRYQPATGDFLVTFDPFKYLERPRPLLLAGDFNGWSLARSVQTGFRATDKRYCSVSLDLSAGYYEYKYFDVTLEQWLEVSHDPQVYYANEEQFTLNPFGTMNCWFDLPA